MPATFVQSEPPTISSLRGLKLVFTGDGTALNQSISVQMAGNMQGAHLFSPAAQFSGTITVNDDDEPAASRDLLQALGVVVAGTALELNPNDLNDLPVLTKNITIASGATVLSSGHTLTVLLYWRGYGN